MAPYYCEKLLNMYKTGKNTNVVEKGKRSQFYNSPIHYSMIERDATSGVHSCAILTMFPT